MNLKNYTSSVPAITSIGRIETALVKAGATDIRKKYDQGVCRAVTFRMLVNNQPLFFQLSAKVDACYGALVKEIKDTLQRTREQAERTAWKIISDWVDIQLSMIMLEQADPMEIFLPYAYDPETDTTFYNKLKNSGFKGLLGPAKN